MTNLEVLERAFTLAEQGEVSNMDELYETLSSDGVTQADLAQISWKGIEAATLPEDGESKTLKQTPDALVRMIPAGQDSFRVGYHFR